jgi:hypothetical protein
MLAKQWQMGEFLADDAGSPLTSKVYLEKTMLTKYRPAGNAVEAFDDQMPLEARVEQRQIPFRVGDVEVSLDLRLVMGRHWLKLLDKKGFNSTLKDRYIESYPVYDPDPDKREDVYYVSNQVSWRKHAAAAKRLMDGKKLYDDILKDSASTCSSGADPYFNRSDRSGRAFLSLV